MGRKMDECSKLMTHSYFYDYKLQKLGLRKDLVGYYYLVEILTILINENRTVRSFSKEIYPSIASRYNRNDCTVERDIRHCINNQWNKIKDKLKDFWDKPSQPTCRKFIFVLKNYIMSFLI